MRSKNIPQKTSFNLRRDPLVCLLLILTTFSVYWQVKDHEFVNYDDGKYITANHYVQDGLNVRSIAWSFTSTHASNWHPLTWLSLMLGCQLYGMDSGWHHLTNVVFHIANTLLLFLVFRKMTGVLWQSSFVAALFALHPLHVESVAWIAERKDVLSTFFWMLTMWGYIRYVDRPSIAKYLSVLLFFSLGLLSKPMLVTLPFVLLLLDYWPLGRFQAEQSIDKSKQMLSSLPLRLVCEKIPFFVLAAASCAVTFLVQQKTGAVRSLDIYPLTVRIANALVSYVNYLVKMLWPFNLAVLYPHSGMPPGWQVVGVCMVLGVVSFLALRSAGQWPWLTIGWLWYLGTLVPVVGMVQVGIQAMADRYTYVPLIGMYVIVAWGAPEILAGWRFKKIVIAVTALAVISILIVTTWSQLRYWANSSMLWEHTIDVTKKNYVAHNNLGNVLTEQGRADEAISHFQEVLRIVPDCAEAYYNMGLAQEKQGRTSKAITHYKEALRIDPDYLDVHNNLGKALVAQNRIEEAIFHFSEALLAKPEYAEAYYNMGLALEKQGRTSMAISHLQEALRIKPDFAEAHNNLAALMERQGRSGEAINHYKEALRIKPDYLSAHYNMGVALVTHGRTDEAISHFQEALRIKPDFVKAHSTLGIVLAGDGRTDEAISHLQEALRIKPDFAEVHSTLGVVLAGEGRTDEAISHIKEALRIKPGYVKARSDLEKLLKRRPR